MAETLDYVFFLYESAFCLTGKPGAERASVMAVQEALRVGSKFASYMQVSKSEMERLRALSDKAQTVFGPKVWIAGVNRQIVQTEMMQEILDTVMAARAPTTILSVHGAKKQP